jgi:hypothetical protein
MGGMDENVGGTATHPRPGSTPHETRQALLRKQARGYTLVRHILVQLPEPDETGSRASVLARFVREGKHRALLLYLLLLGAWPQLEAEDQPLQADVWIRALTGPPARRRALTWSRSTLSRAWTDLEEMKLVRRDRQGRLVRVAPYREDGTREPYAAPRGRADRWNAYFVLPDAFWEEDGLFAQLSLPALAMLLLFAKETNKRAEVHFTFDQIQDWYGIRRRTAQKGVSELEKAGVLRIRREVIAAPLSPTGSTVRSWYSLTGDFGHLAREGMRKRASTERSTRLTTAAASANPTKPKKTDPNGATKTTKAGKPRRVRKKKDR